MSKGTFAALIAATLAACATGGASNGGGGLFPGDEGHEARAKAAVRQRVAFDMECTDVQITRISDVTRLGQQMTSMSLGASGCGKKASYYVECVSNWGNITCNARPNTTVVQGSPSKGG